MLSQEFWVQKKTILFGVKFLRNKFTDKKLLILFEMINISEQNSGDSSMLVLSAIFEKIKKKINKIVKQISHADFEVHDSPPK